MRSAIARVIVAALVGLAALAPINPTHALIMGFEDLATRENFAVLGIAESYQGFVWGYGLGPGVENRTFAPDPQLGWAVATSTFPCCSAAPYELEGSSYGWNWNGTQSLWIDFNGPVDLPSLSVAQGYPVLGGGIPFNSLTLQLFGYDALDNLVASSGVVTLTDTFETLSANFSGISFLEIRSDRNGSWFSVDTIVANEPVTVPEPGTLLLLSGGLVSMGLIRRRRPTNA